MNQLFSDDHLTRYVLGVLPEPERARLEEAYFADDALFARLRALEEDLVADYALDRLPEDVRWKVARRLEYSGTLRERARLAVTLSVVLDGTAATSVPQGASDSTTAVWWTGGLGTWTGRRIRFAAVAAAAVVLTSAALWVSTRRSESVAVPPERASATHEVAPPPETSTQPAPPNATPGATPPDTPQTVAPSAGAPATRSSRAAVAAFVLSPAFRRSGDRPPELRVPRGTEYLRLTLPLAEPADGRLDAAIRTYDGDVVWRVRGVRAHGRGEGRSVELMAPARLLGKEPYLVTVERRVGNGEHETVEEFSFSVVRTSAGRSQ